MAKSKWPEVKEKLNLVEKWKRDGLTELQIAKNLGISKATLEEYKKIHPDFLAAIKRGKEVFITEVENALAKRALGFEYEETKTYIKTTGKTNITCIRNGQELPREAIEAIFTPEPGDIEGGGRD